MLREKIFSVRHVWDFRDVPGVSKKCQEDFDVFIGALDSFELWAVKSESNLKIQRVCVDFFSDFFVELADDVSENSLKFKVIH